MASIPTPEYTADELLDQVWAVAYARQAAGNAEDSRRAQSAPVTAAQPASPTAESLSAAMPEWEVSRRRAARQRLHGMCGY